MEDQIRAVRLLKIYAAFSTLLCGAFLFTAFTQANQRPRFEEIDVERINVVGKDGRLRMVISNRERMPDLIAGGKVIPRNAVEKTPGMLFYNDDGDECGGLRYGSGKVDDKRYASAHLLFDQYNQDRTVGILYETVEGSHQAGFRVWDRPDRPVEEAKARGESEAARVFLGKDRDKAALLVLSDPQGKPRIRILVDAAGNPKIEFLDAGGKVLHSLPPATSK